MQRGVSILLLGSVALVASTLFVVGQDVNRAGSPETVANLLDKLVQPRFLQDAGKFGMERLVIAGHEDQSDHGEETVYYLKARDENEKSLLRSANAAGRNYAIGFIHCVHKPGKFLPKSKTNTGGVSQSILPGSNYQTLVVHQGKQNLYEMPDGFETEGWNKRNLVSINRSVKKALPRLKQGQQVNVSGERMFLALRPIKASQASCLGCHRGAKPDDTLGIMAYAVSTKKP